MLNNNHLQLFNFNEANKEIRTILDDTNNIWFCLKDVCDILEITNSRDVVSRLEKDGVDTIDIGVKTGIKKDGSDAIQMIATNFIDESNLYQVVFQSRKIFARKFSKWITSEVIPSIRKKGYHIQQNLSGIDYANMMVEIAQKLQYAEQEKIRLAEENKLMLPKVEFYDDVVESKDAIDIGSVAKVINKRSKFGKIIGRNQLFEILRKEKVLMNNNQPYQKFIDDGYFRTIEQKWSKPDGSTHISVKTVVYQKGVDYIRKILKKY